MNRIHYPQLDETVYSRVLENGLTVKVVTRPGFTKRLAYFVTDFGSIHTDFVYEGQKYHVPAGIAHYLEHKMFDLPGDRDVSREFASWGAVTNAFTSYDMTAYYFSCTENFDKCLRLLLEFVSTPYFTEETVAKEQGIIDQEIGMSLDSPDNQIFERLMEAAYHAHPVRVPILGTSETIRQITAETLHLCHRAFYTPGNMMLCVIGDVDPAEVESIALDVLGSQPRPVAEICRDWLDPLPCPRKFTTRSMEVAMPSFSMAFKCDPLPKGSEGIRQEMVADLAAEALFGESSPLYLKMYEEGLIDSAFGGGFETLDGCAMLMCSGDSETPEQVRDAILARAAELAETGIPEENFLRMKRSALGRRIRELDSFDSTCFRLCAYHLSDFDYFAFPGIYQQITREEIREFLGRVVREEHCSLSVITPLT